MSAEDQQRDGVGQHGGSGQGDGTDRVAGHPDASSESVDHGRNGGTGR